MELLNSIIDFLQALVLLLIVLWLIKIDRQIVPKEEPKPHKPLFKPKDPKETEEEKRQRILSENIDNYNGTKEGQTRI